MPRAALIQSSTAAVLAVLLAMSPSVATAADLDPHIDTSLVRAGCAACHRGHGASRSPMLPAPQRELCLACHGSRSDRDRAVQRGRVAARGGARLLDSVLSQAYRHPINRQAFSAEELGAVTCTSCHSPHRGNRDAGAGPLGRRRRSPKDPGRFEYELCEGCHGSGGGTTQSLTDISRLLHPGNPSYHPVEAPARESSPSVIASLAGREINCTDCHGNSDPQGPRGPHGSSEPFILRAPYAAVDGSPEAPTTYALCYGCHRRTAVLDNRAFEEHGEHVVEYRASCATCHTAHGSLRNRALIRFGEETSLAGAAPSTSTGRLEFVSDGPGSGACYVTCHGKDHGPEAYGALRVLQGPEGTAFGGVRGQHVARPASTPPRY